MKNHSVPQAAIVGRAQFTSNYEKALQQAGITARTLLSIGSLQKYDLLLLPGGGDITPAFFGQENEGSRNIDTELDILQIQALDCFVRQKKPVLGICKGMQLINIFFGGSLKQHLPTASAHEYQNKDQYHQTTLLPGSTLHKLYGEHLFVNSAHHQGVAIPGKSLLVTQTAEDSVIEGLEHTTLPILGVQWHPERLDTKKTAADGSLLFQKFITFSKS